MQCARPKSLKIRFCSLNLPSNERAEVVGHYRFLVDFDGFGACLAVFLPLVVGIVGAGFLLACFFAGVIPPPLVSYLVAN